MRPLPVVDEDWVPYGWTLEAGPPRSCGGDYLYVDFDGVLHDEDVHPKVNRGVYFGAKAYSEGRTPRFFEHADILLEAIKPYPRLRLVGSSSWFYKRGGYARVLKKLPPELSRRFVGCTYHKRMDWYLFHQAPRGMQIWSDVRRRHPRRWLAIDDDDRHWPAWCRDKLVLTDQRLGISEPTVYATFVRRLAEVFGS